MVRHFKFLFPLLIILVSCASRKAVNDPVLETGVDRSLAVYRKSVLTDIHYTLELIFRRKKHRPFPRMRH